MPMSEPKQSPFFKLPAELRNDIYDLVFEDIYKSSDVDKGCLSCAHAWNNHFEIEYVFEAEATAPLSCALLRSY